jgi:hypothetical protein
LQHKPPALCILVVQKSFIYFIALFSPEACILAYQPASHPLLLPPLQLRPIMKGFSGVRAGYKQTVSGVSTSRSRLYKSNTATSQQQLVQQQQGVVSNIVPLLHTPTSASSSRCSSVCQAAATAVAPAAAVGAVPRGETAGAVLVLEDVTVQVRKLTQATDSCHITCCASCCAHDAGTAWRLYFAKR